MAHHYCPPLLFQNSVDFNVQIGFNILLLLVQWVMKWVLKRSQQSIGLMMCPVSPINTSLRYHKSLRTIYLTSNCRNSWTQISRWIRRVPNRRGRETNAMPRIIEIEKEPIFRVWKNNSRFFIRKMPSWKVKKYADGATVHFCLMLSLLLILVIENRRIAITIVVLCRKIWKFSFKIPSYKRLLKDPEIPRFGLL